MHLKGPVHVKCTKKDVRLDGVLESAEAGVNQSRSSRASSF